MSQNAQLFLNRSTPIAPPVLDHVVQAHLKSGAQQILNTPVTITPGGGKAPAKPGALVRNTMPKAQITLPGATGFILLSAPLAAQILCARMGITPRENRHLSAIDLALCGLFPELITRALSDWLGRPASVGPLCTAPLSLPKQDWQVLSFDIKLGQAVRAGLLRILLPANLAPAPLAPRGAHMPAPPLSPDTIDAIVQRTPLSLTAVLHRLLIQPDDMADLQSGDILPLPDNCLGDLQIEMTNDAHTAVARARLGAFDGRKVLKLHGAPDARQLTPHDANAQKRHEKVVNVD